MKFLKASAIIALTSATLIFWGSGGKEYDQNSIAMVSETEGKTMLTQYRDHNGNWGVAQRRDDCEYQHQIKALPSTNFRRLTKSHSSH